MANNNEKARKKELKDEWKKEQQAIFERSLPMKREQFKKLFDYLNIITKGKDNDNTMRFTQRFLIENIGEKGDAVIKWLNKNGAYSDLEILFNIEELFEQ